MLFASMKAAQFTNWTDVLVVIGGSDTETRVASSKAESQKFPCWVWIVCIDTNICLWLMCTNALWLIVYIFLYLHTDDYTKNMIIFTLYTL